MPTSPKLIAARWSLATAAGLAGLKLFTGMATGSLAVLSSAADSLLDILVSGVNYLALRQADRPADANHPFGHGKYETLATLIQSGIIALSGGAIIFESIRRLWYGSELQHLEGGMLVLGISAAVSWQIGRYLKRVARRTDSSALRADALHFTMDVWTNLALVIGLAAMSLTGAAWLDPVLSLLVAGYILFEAVRLVRHGLRDILDEELPEVVRTEIARLIEAHQKDLLGWHKLRTRRAGSQKIMDFHLTVCKHLTVEQAHAIADQIEKRIEEEIPGADVTIHVEPCEKPECPGREICLEEKARPRQNR